MSQCNDGGPMIAPRRHNVSNGRPLRRGFTLAELVISTGIMAILATGMVSAVLIATHALPDDEDLSERTAAAVEAVERISRDLALATSVITADPNVVQFTVPDRGHGAAGPETIRYAWSGTPGDPLEHQYNGGPVLTLCEDVHDFSLEYTRKAMPLSHTPRVLLIVADDVVLTAQDRAKLELMESWGFTVQLCDDDDTIETMEATYAMSDVVYISEEVSGSKLVSKVSNVGWNIVNEEEGLVDDLGIAHDGGLDTYDGIVVTDDSHEITAGFSMGDLSICQSYQDLWDTTGQLAPGARVLANTGGGGPGLVVVEVEGQLLGGYPAKARQVKLPWGRYDFDITKLTSAGEKIMRRAIVWAAAPVGVSGVKITLQVGSDPSARVETQVQLLNLPEEQ